MNAWQFFDALGELSDRYILEAMAYEKKKNRARLRRLAAAACLLVVLGGAFALFAARDEDAATIISQYGNASGVGSEASYAVPAPGQLLFAAEVSEAREHYAGEPVRFLLAIDIFKNEESELSAEEKAAEYDRLLSLGYRFYEVEYWSYTGYDKAGDTYSKTYEKTVAGCFSEEELESFPADPNYGYFFSFVTNGDGTGASVDESDAVTEFPTGYS